MFWGLTPALNLQQELSQNGKEKLNFLIVGGADCRHIIQTIAKRYRHKPIQLNFYLIEACVENIAKQLLLLNVAFQPQSALGLERKTKIFMELYGNSMVRPAVARYLGTTALDLIKMVTNYDYLKEQMSFLNLQIKYKERDYLENLIKFWCSKDDFNICDSWDRRLRKILGVRYDTKMGAFDWDLNMRFYSVGGNQICNQEYKSFRLNGISFNWLESEVSKPNRSMVCGVIPNGSSFIHHGYLGDMETGPFVAFGLSCEDDSFLKATNGLKAFRATDVTERNLKQIFYEIWEQSEYKHERMNDHQFGSIMLKEDKLVVDMKAMDIVTKATAKCIHLEDVTITFLSLSSLKSMEHNEEYKNFFDLIYFGNTYVKYLNKDMIERVSTTDCVLMIENQLFVLSKRKKDLEEHQKDIEEKLYDLKWEKFDFNPEKDLYLKYCNVN